ncbi:hypothetical protein K9M42_02640 [Patescibacteria group bacterium]|nr:hypothetical protein [Patescibacteria group bacterium]
MKSIICGIEKKTGIDLIFREDSVKKNKNIFFNNYFYVNIKQYEKRKNFISENYLNYYKLEKFNDYYYKIILNDNLIRKDLVNYFEEKISIKTFENDIHSFKRFLINNQDIKLNQNKLKIGFIDIETYDKYPLEQLNNFKINAKDPILSCAIKDINGKEWFFINEAFKDDDLKSYKDNLKLFIKDRKNNPIPLSKIKKAEKILFEYEKKLLEEVLVFLKEEFDLTFSWNGWNFDIPFLKERAKKHNIIFPNNFLINLDYMVIYKNNVYETLKSYSLENVALYEFKDIINQNNNKNIEEVKKVNWKKRSNFNKIYEMYFLDQELLKEYNIQDVRLMSLIESKLKFIDLLCVISDICHCPIQDTLFNTKSFDYAMLNEYYNRKIVAPSKPTKKEIEARRKIFISGGYTYVYEKGIHDNIYCFDYKSFYPTQDITFNISPETYITEVDPDLELVFNNKEIEYINYVISNKIKYTNKLGKLNNKKYEKDIEEKRKELQVSSMFDLMFKFVKKYKNEKLIEICKENNIIYTPADINYDTNGWSIHPHRIFKKEEGVFPFLCKNFLLKRDEVKYKLKDFKSGSHEWEKNNIYQIGLKTLANAGYGAFGFKSFRFFKKQIGDTITSSCRYIVKKSILFAKSHGYYAKWGDTDSCYFVNENSNLSVDKLNEKFYNYYKIFIKDYNTNCKIELINPNTKQKEINNHFIVFELEKTLERAIVVAKKRYYFKDSKGNYATQGGAYKKANTMPLAASFQKEMVKNILDNKYDRKELKKAILYIKKIVFNHELTKEHLLMNVTINKPIKDYFGYVIDSKTGNPKVKKDGTLQEKAIPTYIKLAKKLEEKGEYIEIPYKINYIIIDSTKRLECISEEEFEKTKKYDENYYWERIQSPIIEILEVIEKENTYEYFWECWNYKESQKKTLLKNLNK